MLRKRSDFSGFDSYTMVYNELKEGEFESVSANTDRLREIIRPCENVFYYINRFQPEYYRFCRVNEPDFGWNEEKEEDREKLYE